MTQFYIDLGLIALSFLAGFAVCAHIHNTALASAVARATTLPGHDIDALKAQVAALTAKVMPGAAGQTPAPVAAPAVTQTTLPATPTA